MNALANEGRIEKATEILERHAALFPEKEWYRDKAAELRNDD